MRGSHDTATSGAHRRRQGTVCLADTHRNYFLRANSSKIAPSTNQCSEPGKAGKGNLKANEWASRAR